MTNDITPIGITDWRNSNTLFGIKDRDRLQHIYCIGKSGVGKTTLLANMAISDIQKGKGCAVIDPHGDLAEQLLHYVPHDRIQEVVYFNPKDLDYPIAFNPLKGVHPSFHHLVASGLVSTFKKIWADSWGPRMEYILRFSILTLLWYPDATLLDIQSLLTDREFRNHVLSYTKEQHILSFWRLEFDKYSLSFRNEAVSPILNKVGVFSASLPLRNTVGQKVRGFNLSEIMDTGKIFIANLSKGEIGEDASTILGSILVTSFQLAALSRAAQDEAMRKPFYLYIDEAHSLLALPDILSECRKYKLGLFLAHQYIGQMHEKVREAIFGNVGTVISFRVGAEDAEVLAKEFYPTFTQDSFVHLPRYSMYLKLMIDGATSKSFSAITVPISAWSDSSKQKLVAFCRKKYAANHSSNVTNKQKVELASSSQSTLFD